MALLFSYFSIKLISAGKMIDRGLILDQQGIRNNQQMMAIVLKTAPDQANADNQVYDKVKSAKEDASMLVDSKNDFMDVSTSLLQQYLTNK